MRVRRRAWERGFGAPILVGAGVLASLGCDGEEELGPTERYCEALCSRAAQCDLAGGTCAGICNESADVGPLRDDVAEEFASCFSGQDCADLTSAETFAGCWEQLQGRFAATEYGRKFCVAYASHIFSCGYEYSAEACEASYGIFTDEALERLVACTQRPCEQLDACAEQKLWDEP